MNHLLIALAVLASPLRAQTDQLPAAWQIPLAAVQPSAGRNFSEALAEGMKKQQEIQLLKQQTETLRLQNDATRRSLAQLPAMVVTPVS
jgi:hypothetical protein